MAKYIYPARPKKADRGAHNKKRQWQRDDQKKNTEKVKRKCLKCGRSFIARGRYNRICPKCTLVNRTITAGSADPGSVGVRIEGYYYDG